MSDRDSRVAEIEKNLKDITECSICAETFKDPKVLSCLHTFCKDCLQQLVTKLVKSAGEEVPCPICRKKFLVPVDGCDNLQRNFFMERLIEIKGITGSSSNDNACEACLEVDEQVDKKEVPKAEVFCSDCQQKLCKDCHKYHLRNKLTKNHKMLILGEHLEMEISNVVFAAKSEFCEKHYTKPLDIYCIDCKEVACSICFVENHKSHEGKTAESASNDFKTTIQQNVDRALEFMFRLKEKSEQTNTCKSIMIEKYRDLEIGINQRREELIALIDTHTNALLSELSTRKDAYLKRMSICNDEIGTLMSCLGSYETYCKQISTFGTASSICKVMTNISARGTELRTVCGDESQNVLESPALRLNARLSLKDLKSSIENYIGEIADPITQIYRAKKRSLTKFNSISKSLLPAAILRSLTILGDEIFLAVEIEQNKYLKVFVEVYDLKTLWLKRNWENSKLAGIKDMKSSESNKCLFILRAVENSEKREVVRFDSRGTLISSWPVSNAVVQLSVTDEPNVLSIVGKNRFDEYSPEVRRLCALSLLSADASSSGMLGVMLNSDRFVVGNRVNDEFGKICIVDRSGKTLKSVEKVGKGWLLEWPFHLGKDKDSNVIVVDRDFSRLTVFDANLNAINEPKQLSLDQRRSKWSLFRCYVLDNVIIDESNRRVFVRKNFEISIICF